MRLVVFASLSLGLAAIIALALGGREIVTSTASYSELTEIEQASVAAYKYFMDEKKRSAGPPFCLAARRELILTIKTLPMEAGPGVSGTIVSALRANGYDAFSASDCVYRADGGRGLRVSPRSADRAALLILVDVQTVADNAKFSIWAHYWYDSLGCATQTFEVVRGRAGYEVVAGSVRKHEIC